MEAISKLKKSATENYGSDEHKLWSKKVSSLYQADLVNITSKDVTVNKDTFRSMIKTETKTYLKNKDLYLKKKKLKTK